MSAERPISRRALLGGTAGVLGTAALGGVAGSLVTGGSGAAADTGDSTGTLPTLNISPLMFHSPPVTPFVDELPRLPVLQAGSTATLDANLGSHRFHRDYDASPAFGYGGQGYLGPVIEAHVEQPLTLTYRNQLAQHPFAKDIDTTLMETTTEDGTAPRSVLHLHGAVTAPPYDGHARATIRPGVTYRHLYPNRQEACALWYHDHAVGITRLNVYAGLAAPYLLRDRYDTGTSRNPLGLPSGEYEVPLVLQEKIFTSGGRQSVRSTPIVPQGSWEGGAVGDVGLVNGKAFPQLLVDRGLYRLRLLNANSYSVANLSFGNRMRFWVIGTDGGLLNAPVAVTAVRMAPAERVDVLVDFSQLAAGATVELRNDEPVPGQAAELGEVTMPVFCRFKATSARGFRGSVPTRLRGGAGRPARLPALGRPSRVRNLTIAQPFEFRLPPAMMSLNNLMFGSPYIEKPVQGTVEQWNLIDVTPDPHPIHIHLVNFRVLGRQPIDTDSYRRDNPTPAIGTKWAPSADRYTTGPMVGPQPEESGWKDTVRTDGNHITRILVRFPTAAELGFDPDESFDAPAGSMAREMDEKLQGYMWHCHLLDHEDHDMMLDYRTVAR